MAEKLTPQQQMAVENRGGNLLVSAAAGSGKTKVLVDRLLKYIMDPVDPANIDDFLIITYTKAAAAELRGKIAVKLSEHIANDPTNKHLQRQLQRLYLAKISTVHAFCADILREYAYRLDIPADFQVGDENECARLRQKAMDEVLEQAYSSIGDNPAFQAFVDTQGLGRSDMLVAEIVERVYDSAKCHLSPSDWLDRCICSGDISGITDASQTIWGRYLMDDLFEYLDEQIKAMSQCASMVSAVPGLEKPAATLADTVNQLAHLRNSGTWDEIVSRSAIDYGRLTFPKKADDPAVTEPVKAVRKACKEGLAKRLRCFADYSQQVLSDLKDASVAASGLINTVRQFSKRFDSLKQGRHILDFADLEHITLDLLLGKSRQFPTVTAKEIGSRFREIMVDEYQDSNAVQDAIFSALTDNGRGLFMVGDVKQSIYQFRLADPGIFLDKYNHYTPAEEAGDGQGRKVLLSANFRSGGGVINAVNDVFSDCMSPQVGGLVYGENEALREGIPHIQLPEPEVELRAINVVEDTYAEEAAFVAERIVQLLDGQHFIRNGDSLRPIVPEDIVILLRSPGSVGADFQYALNQRGVPCATGGGTDLFLTEEIGTLRALLQVISNSHQDIPLIATMASPVFGFTADELAAIRSIKLWGDMYDALRQSDSDKSRTFCNTVEKLRQASKMLSLPELIEEIFRLTHMDAIYTAMDAGQSRKSNLQAFYQMAVDFSGGGHGDLDAFLEHLNILEEKGLVLVQEQSVGGSVTIMSIHKSKGLEFPVVFLCGLSRKFNRESQNAPVLCDRELGLGLSCVDSRNRIRYPSLSKYAIAAKISSDSLSEEMRVLYVAMTRARDRLIMTYASGSLASDVTDIAARMDISSKALMTQDVSNPGQWVLYSALQRTEAGALFALGGQPRRTDLRQSPWKIVVDHASQPDVETQNEGQIMPEIPFGAFEQLRSALSFKYPYAAASVTPSKQTATQRKGRIKDQEAAEGAVETKPASRNWRRPSFLTSGQDGRLYGSAIHAVMQYIRYEACSDVDAIRREVDRLVMERYITPEQGELADCVKLAAFFTSEFGTRLREHPHVLREFKFSILDDASAYGSDITGESVLLQGVVDCAIIDDDGITVIDFKTDRVTGETLQMVASDYCPQVQTYADALSRIYELPVKAKALYFFHIDQFYWL